MLKLRGHHILCFHQFQGYGYNEEFVENMYNVIDEIKSNENKLILIVTKDDSICSKCPNLNSENICELDHEGLIKFDKHVIKSLDIEPNTYITLKELKEKIRLNLTEEVFKSLCSGCSWYKGSYCAYERFKDNK